MINEAEERAWDELERKQAKKWDASDMAHRSGGLTVEQAEKESTLQEISDIGQEIEQKPVAWVRDLTSPQPHYVTSMKYLSIADTDAEIKYIPVYTSPPKREWVSLTDEEIVACGWCDLRFARAIEAKLKDKNNG